MLPRVSRSSMRLLQPLLQMRQIASNSSNCRINQLMGISQPLTKLAFAKPPLAADFDGGNFFALRPKANGSRRYTQPLGDSSRRQKWFAIQ
jgi:hypothetical protein